MPRKAYYKIAMETAVVIEKVIAGCKCKKIINNFIKLSLFTQETFVEHDFCDSDCGVIEFLVGTSLCFGLLTDNIEKNYKCFGTILEKTIKTFFLSTFFNRFSL